MDFNVTHNVSDNSSFDGHQISENVHSPWIKAAQVMRSVVIPVIAGVGLVGNTLSLMVFLSRRMRKSPCSVFQAALAIVDNTFLFGLLITWMDGECHAFLTVDLACQLLIFITYVTSFLSVWFIVGFTCERFLAIYFPLKCKYICNSFRQKVIVVVLTLTAIVLYIFTFWMFEMKQWNSSLKCMFKTEHYKLLNIVVWIDTFLTMVIPFILITVLNALIVRAVFNSPERRESLSLRSLSSNSSSMESNERRIRTRHLEQRSSQQPYSSALQRNGFGHFGHRSQIRVTKRLLLVSSMFLLLNLPSHIMRLHNLIVSATSNTITITPRFFFLQELTLMWYYTTFSCNFFLYVLKGYNFKETLFHVLRCRKSKESFRKEMLSKFKSTTTGNHETFH
ncbi:neurotensin receptor type 1-like [Mercenaria mercenaria]|uniref:neurotensin receptor type 1-like n=1 Tax=Mercenaria mercenaria TaxID=6596 RepID=UPI001E1D7D2F|nr:neurotensin receptor type 1-like [Mercenaria mercenaria]